MKTITERARLDALAGFEILDSAPEETFDRITALLSRILGVAHACISFVDRERVWFKSAHGLSVSQVNREPGLCHTVVETGALVHYEDASTDSRSRSNSLTKGEDGIRFYVGAPLVDRAGFRIGTLCAFSSTPRCLTEAEGQIVTDLTSLVMHEVDARRTRNQLERTEAVLRHSQRLESIGIVASGVAHDFNNMLGGIIGNIALLKIALDGTDRVQELLDEVESAAHRAAELSSQVLAYAGREDMTVNSPVNLNASARSTCKMLELILNKSTSLKLDLDESIPFVSANSISLSQVAMNLITNASEAYLGKPGEVRVATFRRADGKIALQVSDDGIGMDAATRASAMNAFFTTKVGGRGLGMAVVGRIVQQLGGSLELESDPGVGTTIRIILPHSEASSPQNTVKSDDCMGWRAKGTVLVIDDEPSIRAVATRALSLVGLDVISADSGESGLREFKQNRERIVAVIVDLSLPNMDGNDVMRAIHGIAPGVPVILASGHTREDISTRVELGRLAGVLTKPFSPNEMIRAVRKAVTC